MEKANNDPYFCTNFLTKFIHIFSLYGFNSEGAASTKGRPWMIYVK